MPPIVAAGFCGVGVLALFLLSRDRKSQVSAALWLPVVWLSLSASRTVGQWLEGGASANSAEELIEGSPLDAGVFAGLLLMGLVALMMRRRRAGAILSANSCLLAFYLYCALSLFWSDFAFVAFKRWIKAVGDLVMILIVLTERDRTAAIKTLLSRTGFLLVPLSILLIRYYPAMGRGYSAWTGEAYNIGVATGKNGLGYVCLTFGLGSVWGLLLELRNRKRAPATLPAFVRGVRLVALVSESWVVRTAPILAQAILLVLTLWLFQMAHSATSLGCFLIGCLMIAMRTLRPLSRSTAIVHMAVPAMLFVISYGLILDPSLGLAEAMGRDSTLTGRRTLWNVALSESGSSAVGVGYESFWMGPRLERIWQVNWEHPNQAHNGYLELYLDLGWFGIALLGLVMLRGYTGLSRTFRVEPEAGGLRLAFFVVAAIYNLTEHAFRELHPVWILFLLAVTVVPRRRPIEAR